MPAQLMLPGLRIDGFGDFGAAIWKPRPQTSSPAPSGYGLERSGSAVGWRRTFTLPVWFFEISATVLSLRMRTPPSCPRFRIIWTKRL